MALDTSIKYYGVRENSIVQSQLEQCAEEIKLYGYTIMKDLIPSSMLQTTRDKFDQLYLKQAEQLGGKQNLEKINDANVIRCPCVEDSFFLQLATLPKILELMTLFFGEYFILQQQNGILLPPHSNNYQAFWHRDLPYQHFTSSRPLAISALFCIDEFNATTGGTYVLPASHKTEAFPSQAYILSHEKGIEAEPGDALVFDSMLYHRAGHNHAAKIRRGLNHVYSLPFLKQQISFPKAFQGKYSEDVFLRKFLDYDSEPANSAYEWRNKRLRSL